MGIGGKESIHLSPKCSQNRCNQIEKVHLSPEKVGTGGAIENKELNPVLKHLSPETYTSSFRVYLSIWGQVNGDKWFSRVPLADG